MKNIVNINNLNYKVFNNLNMTIKENSLIAISGPNNSGKTTLMRIINGEKDLDLPIKLFDKSLNEYKLGEYKKIVQFIYPLEVDLQDKTLEEDLKSENANISEKISSIVLKELHTKKLLKVKYTKMTSKELILSQLTKALITKPKILLIDELSLYLDKKEIIDIINYLRKYQIQENITIIYTTLNLDEIIDFDYLYILNNGKVAIEGQPLAVLQKDNLLNKIGLKIPFMIDLSVKLKDYELISDIELTPEGMVEKLWN